MLLKINTGASRPITVHVLARVAESVIFRGFTCTMGVVSLGVALAIGMQNGGRLIGFVSGG